MKKVVAFLTALVMAFSLAACGSEPEPDPTPEEVADPVTVKIEEIQMQAICELAAIDCYYHNVAKFTQEDVWKFLWWSKDKQFWVEYGGTVRLGVDASLMKVSVAGNQVVILLPPVKVLSSTVDPDSMTYVQAKKTADITPEDEKKALAEAQKQLKESAASNQELLNSALQRVQNLLGDYVNNIGTAIGQTYTIQWGSLGTDDTTTTAPPEAGT